MVDVEILLQQVGATMARPRHATYRLQLGAALGFEGVADLGPYLRDLGVSDAYLSPCFKCGPGELPTVTTSPTTTQPPAERDREARRGRR